MPRLTKTVSKPEKRVAGRTDVWNTPLAIRSKLSLTDRFRDRVRERLGRALSHFATLVERASVRFEDVNGPRGGVDTVCRVKLVMSNRPSVVVEQTGADVESAFNAVVPRVSQAVKRDVGRRGGRTPKPTRGSRVELQGAPRAKKAASRPGDGSVIGRRVGHSADNLAEALERPEKRRRDAYVDTAEAGVSEADRRAGGNVTARRNSKQASDKATAALEDSRTTPSRKSTRRSANRTKAATQLTKRTIGNLTSSAERASRAAARAR